MVDKYYAADRVVVQDRDVELEKLVRKKVQFVTRQLIVPEDMVEACVELFDETVEFNVVPAGMTLFYGDTVLDEHLLEKKGSQIFVYGSVKVEESCRFDILAERLEKLIVHGTVTLKKEQEESFRKLHVEYKNMEFEWEGRLIENKPGVRIDKTLLDSSPKKVLVRNSAAVKIAEDVTSELILDRLRIENCASVSCSEEQESAIAAVAQNVVRIGSSTGEIPGVMGGIKDLLSAKVINADNYIM